MICTCDCKVCGNFRLSLEKIAKREIKFPDYDWSDWNGEDAKKEVLNLIATFAQLVLSENTKERKNVWDIAISKGRDMGVSTLMIKETGVLTNPLDESGEEVKP